MSVSIIEKAVGKLETAKTELPLPELVASPTPQEAFGDNVLASPAMNQSGESQGDVGRPAADEVSLYRQQPKTAEINIARLQDLGILTPDGGRSVIAEEFRYIKRPLIENAFRKTNPIRHGNLIMVTSAMPGEGKTFCAINLAMSIAMEMDHTVLLVDADVARPSVPHYLGLEVEGGLMDLLLNEKSDFASVMLNTNIERLRLLPSGHSHKRATELLASQAMSNLLEEIATRYPDRIVIFDSPPILLTSEARALAHQMGQIVLVVAAESTTQHGVKDAINKIGNHPNISLVYNKAKGFPGMGYYAEYY